MGIIERIGSLSGTEAAKALNLGHAHFQDRMGDHGHFARALLETIAEVCRNHPNLAGIVVGLAVEQFLVHEKHVHEQHLLEQEHADHEGAPAHAPAPARTPVVRRAAPAHTPHLHLRMAHIKPGKLALEVFGALILLKFSAGVARALRRKNKREIWFAPAARIRLWSGTFAAYYAAKAVSSHKVSAWRNAAVALFFTDAIKPLLKPPKRRRGAPPPEPRPVRTGVPPPAPVSVPAPVQPIATLRPDPAAAHANGHDHGHGHAGGEARANGHDPHPAPVHHEPHHPESLAIEDEPPPAADHGHAHAHDDGHPRFHGHDDAPEPVHALDEDVPEPDPDALR